MISVDRKMPITDSLQHNRANYLSDRDQFVAEYPELADDLDTVALPRCRDGAAPGLRR